MRRFEITEQQQINFTEAALVRYFKHPAHKTYSQCYDLDLNAVNVELQTEEIMCRLWSPSVAPSWTHFAMLNFTPLRSEKAYLIFSYDA